MEDKRNGKVHSIELWDEAHKKKDGSYSNDNVKIVLDKSYDQLAKRKEGNSGIISVKDFEAVFDDVVAMESKPRGYYDNKYWSQVKVSQGLPFVDHFDTEMCCPEVKELKNEMKHMSDQINHMQTLLVQRPRQEENAVDEMIAADNVAVNQVHGERIDCNNIQHNSDDNDNHHYYENTDESSATNTCTPTDPMQQVHLKNFSQGNKGSAGLALPREYLTKLKQGYQNKEGPKEVVLVSDRTKTVAKGKLVTTDSTRVVGGNMLGNEYYGVAILGVSRHGNESFPRPYEELSTVRDAIGKVIAWPRSHVKRPPTQEQKCA
ncbi:hypothetical protein ACP4OV_001511 [Aristida adscensionis]